MAQAGAPSIQENTSRLLKHFSGEGPPANDRWAALWDAGDFLPWDQGVPNPALVDLFDTRHDLVGTSAFIEDETGERRRKRALVPGCGRGYDVLLLSSLGYDAYGLEVSSKAVDEARAWADEHLANYPVRNESSGRGKASFVLGDFFADDWIVQADGHDTFDFIYDYTFFCALNPDLRPAWAKRYWELLSTHPESAIVCVEFPTTKKISAGGPPYASPSSVYLAHLSYPGQEITYDVDGAPLPGTGEEKPRSIGFSRIAHWKAERSHRMGNGTDWVSVWKRGM